MEFDYSDFLKAIPTFIGVIMSIYLAFFKVSTVISEDIERSIERVIEVAQDNLYNRLFHLFTQYNLYATPHYDDLEEHLGVALDDYTSTLLKATSTNISLEIYHDKLNGIKTSILILLIIEIAYIAVAIWLKEYHYAYFTFGFVFIIINILPFFRFNQIKKQIKEHEKKYSRKRNSKSSS